MRSPHQKKTQNSMFKRDLSLKNEIREEQLTTGSTICSEKYIISHHIGKGTFGDVYIGVLSDNNNNNYERGKRLPKQVAIKVENDPSKSNQLNNEIETLNKLKADSQVMPGIPNVYTYGVEGGHNFMVLELLGPNLQDLQTMCGGKFSLKTSILLIIQIIQKTEFLHAKGFIYRDIKPQNFVMGINDKSQELYMIDFGMCKAYKDSKTNLFIPYKENIPIVGTIRYASLNSHLGIEQSRRDDLESILYVLIYFLKGQLPWQGIKAQDKFEKDHVIMQSKLKISTKELCQNLPFQIHNIFDYIKSLDFYEDPDYRYIISQFSTLYERMGFLLDFGYDWTLLKKNVKHQKGSLLIELRFSDSNEEQNEYRDCGRNQGIDINIDENTSENAECDSQEISDDQLNNIDEEENQEANQETKLVSQSKINNSKHSHSKVTKNGSVQKNAKKGNSELYQNQPSQQPSGLQQKKEEQKQKLVNSERKQRGNLTSYPIPGQGPKKVSNGQQNDNVADEDLIDQIGDGDDDNDDAGDDEFQNQNEDSLSSQYEQSDQQSIQKTNQQDCSSSFDQKDLDSNIDSDQDDQIIEQREEENDDHPPDQK